MSQEIWDREFAEKQTLLGTTSISAWRLSGVSLERAADVLWAQNRKDWEVRFDPENTEPVWSIGAPFMLLAGLAIENYLKGLAVKRSTTAVFDNKDRFIYASHNLSTLAISAGVTINDAERLLLERLTRFIEFAGRYPAPIRAEQLLPLAGVNGDRVNVRGVSSEDYAIWRVFVDRLNIELDAYTNPI